MHGVSQAGNFAAGTVTAETSNFVTAREGMLTPVKNISNSPLLPDNHHLSAPERDCSITLRKRGLSQPEITNKTIKKNKIPQAKPRAEKARKPSLWLKTEAWKWIEDYPVERDSNGKATLSSVAQLITKHKTPLLKTGIRWRDIAEYYQLSTDSLYTYISKIARKSNPVEELTEQQRSWLTMSLQANGLTGKFSIATLARYQLNNSDALTAHNISTIQLAKHCNKVHDSLRKRINEEKNKLISPKIDRKVFAAAWLDKQGPHINHRGKLTAIQIATFYVNKINLLKRKKIYISDLIEFYNINTSTLYSAVDKIKIKTLQPKLPSDKEAWLVENAPQRYINDKTPIIEIARFYLLKKEHLRYQGITLKNIGVFYNYLPSSILITLSRLTKRKLRLPTLTIEETFWFSKKIKNSPNTRNLTLNEYHSISPGNFDKELLRFRDLQNTSASQLTTAAKKKLDQLLLSGITTSIDLANYYLQHIVSLVELGITHSVMAEYFHIASDTLMRKIRKQIASEIAFDIPEASSPVKQEPVSDSESEAELWYRPQLLRNGNIPVLLYKEDEEMVLGYKQGPIREKLVEVDLSTVRITQSPDYPRLLTNRRLRAAATKRLRELINAACQGQLQQLIKDEGYYNLIIDEEHPELGMGLYAGKDIPEGTVLGIYPGVVYSSYQEYLQAAKTVDNIFPIFAFQGHLQRPRRKADGIRKRQSRVKTAIGGYLQTGSLVFANTAEVAEDGTVIASEKNNLAAVKAGPMIIAYVANRKIKAGEKLLIDYGRDYRIPAPAVVKQEPLDN